MPKISPFILSSMIVCFLSGCATSLTVPTQTTDCSQNQRLPINSTSCDCDNEAAVSQPTDPRDENADLQRRLDEVTEELNKLRTQRSQHQTARFQPQETASSEVDKLTARLHISQAELDTQINANRKLQKQLEKLNQLNSRLEKKVAELTKDNQASQSQITTLRAKRDKLTNRVKQLKKQLNVKTTQPSDSSDIFIIKD